MKAFIFPGQGSQFPGMGLDLFRSSKDARILFEKANQILNFDICKLMFEGNEDDLKQTKVTQPAIFIHSVILAYHLSNFKPNMLAGHSLGEFSAITAGGMISFEDGLNLVINRANAMQLACQKNKSTMAAIIGLDSNKIEEICAKEIGIVVTANYNSPNQIVISGEFESVKKTCDILSSQGAKRALILPVGGAFHSPLMESAKDSLTTAINNIEFNKPICPIYQNVHAKPETECEIIKKNLVNQLVKPVRWFQTIQNMISDGANHFYEVGPGNVLIGLNKRINRNVASTKAKI
ncbi:MAG: [acyl-carrier-protein] S-malonyltransferase [Flavobacteriales bacterium]|nr:[acyl-carrier-protein] S-malonyltransferase [Flavobacteriales bacterium]|tara:strand:+ start:19349 stop:20227 length:879 start_codon:yes stop_codon:yes gene_type:complete